MVQLNAKSVIVNVLLVPIKILVIPVWFKVLIQQITVYLNRVLEVLDFSLFLPIAEI